MLAPDDAYFVGGASEGGGGGADAPCEAAPPCTELPEPDIVLTEAEVAVLPGVVADAAPGTTIALEPGTYVLTSSLEISADNVTLRSTTNNAADVVVHGALPSIASITSSAVTVAHLTLTASGDSAIVLNAPPGERSEHVRVCNVIIEDGGESFVRTAEGAGYADCALVEGSTFRLTDAGRAATCCDDCVPAALRVEGGRGWVVRSNAISGFYCAGVAPPVDPAECHTSPFSLLFSSAPETR